MAIRLKTIDTGAINLQAVNNFIDTVGRLKGQRRDREITTGLAGIERESQLAQDIVMGNTNLDEETQLRNVASIRQGARVKKLDLITQSGQFAPQTKSGIGGFLERLGGALDPTDTAGVTDTPLIRGIQARQITQDFPTPTEQARADALRLSQRTKRQIPTKTSAEQSSNILTQIEKFEDAKVGTEDAALLAGIDRQLDDLKKQFIAVNPQFTPEQIAGMIKTQKEGLARFQEKELQEKAALGTIDKVKKAAKGALDFLGGRGARVKGVTQRPLISTAKPVVRKKTRTKTERDKLQAIFEQLTPEELATAEEALKQGKTPEEIVAFFEANQ